MADDALDKAAYLEAQIRKQPEMFTMVNKPMAVNVGFQYIPPAWRGKEFSDEHKAAVTKLIFDRMNE